MQTCKAFFSSANAEKDPAYDASRELLEMFGRKPVSGSDDEFQDEEYKPEEENEDNEEEDSHAEKDNADITPQDKVTIANDVLPFGGWKQVLQQMRLHGAQPEVGHFVLIWQCMISGEKWRPVITNRNRADAKT